MQRDSGIPISTLRADGGMVVNALLMQFQADILDVPVLRPRTIETTALGAAYAAGLAVGYWHDPDDLAATGDYAHLDSGDEPMRRDSLIASWHKAVVARSTGHEADPGRSNRSRACGPARSVRRYLRRPDA